MKELYDAIMNIPHKVPDACKSFMPDTAYVYGHRDARHAAAELVLDATGAEGAQQQAGPNLYRKTALVHAEQFLPAEGKIPAGVISDGHGDPRTDARFSFVLHTLEGVHQLRDGDYICTGPAGEKWNVERSIFESTYELAAPTESAAAPIPMILHCPKCHVQHIDAPDFEDDPGMLASGITHKVYDGWTNPPHRSHLCHACGNIWRPADVATEGVRAIQTKGRNDSEPSEHAPADRRSVLEEAAALVERKGEPGIARAVRALATHQPSAQPEAEDDDNGDASDCSQGLIQSWQRSR